MPKVLVAPEHPQEFEDLFVKRVRDIVRFPGDFETVVAPPQHGVATDGRYRYVGVPVDFVLFAKERGVPFEIEPAA